MKLMNEQGAIEEALYDGYGVAERLLEGVMFRIRVEDDKLVCLGHRKMDDDYMSKFSGKKIAEWHKAILEDILRTEGDMLVCDGADAWLEDVHPKTNYKGKPKVIQGITGDQLMNLIKVTEV